MYRRGREIYKKKRRRKSRKKVVGGEDIACIPESIQDRARTIEMKEKQKREKNGKIVLDGGQRCRRRGKLRVCQRECEWLCGGGREATRKKREWGREGGDKKNGRKIEVKEKKKKRKKEKSKEKKRCLDGGRRCRRRRKPRVYQRGCERLCGGGVEATRKKRQWA